MLALCFRFWLSRPLAAATMLRPAARTGPRCFASIPGSPSNLPNRDDNESKGRSVTGASGASDAPEHGAELQPPPSAEALAKKAASRAFQRLTTPPETLKRRGEAVEDQSVQTAVKWGKGKVKGTLKERIRNPLLMRLGLGFGVLLPAAGVYFSGKAILSDLRRLRGITHAAVAAEPSAASAARLPAAGVSESGAASTAAGAADAGTRHATAADAAEGKAEPEEVKAPRSRKAIAAYGVATAADVALAGAAAAGLAKALREHTAHAAAQVTGTHATGEHAAAAADAATAVAPSASAPGSATPMVTDAADALSLAAEAAAVAPESPTRAVAALHWAAHYWEGALGFPAAAAPALALLATAASLSGQVWEEHGSARAALRTWLPRTAPQGEKLVADVAEGRAAPAEAAAQAARLADAALEEAAPDLTSAPDAAPAVGSAVGETKLTEKLRKAGTATADTVRVADTRAAASIRAAADEAADAVQSTLREAAETLEGAARQAAHPQSLQGDKPHA